VTADDHEYHGKVTSAGVEAGSGNNESENGTRQRPHDVERRVAESVGGPVVDDADDKSNEIRWCGEEKGVGLAVAESLDHTWEEVGDGRADLDAQEHECEDVETPVCKGFLEAVAPALVILVDLTGVFDEAPFCDCLLRGGQPASVGRVVGEKEEGAQSEKDGDGPLNDEQPAPGFQAPGIFESTDDTGGD